MGYAFINMLSPSHIIPFFEVLFLMLKFFFFFGSVPWVLLVACYFESNLILDLINVSFGLATDEVLACYKVKGASGLIMY